MSNLFLFQLVFVSVLSTALPITASASYDRGPCESALLLEFDRRPNLQGIVTTNVPMNPDSLLTAYRRGIFPWDARPDGKASWHSPPMRGVLFLDKVHISSKDQKFLRRELAGNKFLVTVDQAFGDVMRECAEMVRWRTDPRTGERVPDGQWLSPQFLQNYKQLFETGHAHSVEVWHNGILVAGLYGTYVNGVFAGESMFHKEPDAAKLAFYTLIERLKESGHSFIDTQQAKGLVAKWGAQLIPRDQFQTLLAHAQERNLPF